MYKYICPQCGKPSYSAARLELHSDPTCPYCGCNLLTNGDQVDDTEDEGESTPCSDDD